MIQETKNESLFPNMSTVNLNLLVDSQIKQAPGTSLVQDLRLLFSQYIYMTRKPLVKQSFPGEKVARRKDPC